MDEAYAVFDTLSLDGEFDLTPSVAGRSPRATEASTEIAPLLARTPYVAKSGEAPAPAAEAATRAIPATSTDEPETPVAPRLTRIDDRGTETHPHTWAGRDVVAQTSAAIAEAIGPNQRIDTPTAPAPQLEPTAAEPLAPRQDAAGAESLSATLLQIDAIVSPYARWIALAAVVAAIGLTMVLLGGGQPAQQGDTPGSTGNQAQTPINQNVANQSVFAQLDPLGPLDPGQPTPASTEATADAVASSTAAGPASAPRLAAAPTGPAVRLTGDVVVPTDPTPQIAKLPPTSSGYPRTATYPTTLRSTRR
ncbi:MAG: hypothetical protein AAFV43_12535 [Planctomycetota bacterium]